MSAQARNWGPVVGERSSVNVAARRPARKSRPARIKYNRREALAGYLFISPWIIGFVVFMLGAMVYSLVISFSHYNLATNVAETGRARQLRAALRRPQGGLVAGQHVVLRRHGRAVGDLLRACACAFC